MDAPIICCHNKLHRNALESDMKQAAAEKIAAKQSKTEGAQFVVWVFDDGRYVYDREQCRRYAPLIHVEAAFVAGVRIDTAAALALEAA
jgi:hypothetical protein